MSAKEYLAAMRTSALLYEAKRAELDDIIKLAAPSGLKISDYETERVQTSRVNDATVAVNRLCNYIEQLQQDLCDLLTYRKKALNLINRIPSGELQLILFYRYFRILSWADIAERFNASVDWMYRLHGKALTAFAELYDAEDMHEYEQETYPNI